MRYIVVLRRCGLVDFLQMRGVINWYFANNHIKAFKTLRGAINGANKVLQNKHNCGEVHVIKLEPEDDYITACSIERYFNTDKDVYCREFVERRIRHDLSHEEQLYIYNQNNVLRGELRDSYGNVVSSADFPDANGDVYRVREYFGFTENNSYGY